VGATAGLVQDVVTYLSLVEKMAGLLQLLSSAHIQAVFGLARPVGIVKKNIYMSSHPTIAIY
jgi:hypothetical protein